MDVKRYLGPGLVCVVLGFTMMLNARTLGQKSAQMSLRAQSTDEMVAQLITVSKERDRLQEELRVMRDMATQEANRSHLAQQVRLEQAASGLVGVEGPGVVITLADEWTIASVNVQDLLDVMNELRASGAEAIAVGDLRVTERTRIAPHKGGGVAVNGVPVAKQVVIYAVGEPQVLSAGLNMRGGVLEEPRRFYPVTVMEAPLLVIPPVAENAFRYARPVR